MFVWVTDYKDEHMYSLQIVHNNKNTFYVTEVKSNIN